MPGCKDRVKWAKISTQIEKISTDNSICGDGGKASQRKHWNKKIQTNH